MGKIAERYCKHIIITKDNPRNENINKIVQDITREISNYQIILNREEAINYAIHNFPNVDIYILGKGDETTIEEKGVFYEFNDKECVLNYINNHMI